MAKSFSVIHQTEENFINSLNGNRDSADITKVIEEYKGNVEEVLLKGRNINILSKNLLVKEYFNNNSGKYPNLARIANLQQNSYKIEGFLSSVSIAKNVPAIEKAIAELMTQGESIFEYHNSFRSNNIQEILLHRDNFRTIFDNPLAKNYFVSKYPEIAQKMRGLEKLNTNINISFNSVKDMGPESKFLDHEPYSNSKPEDIKVNSMRIEEGVGSNIAKNLKHLAVRESKMLPPYPNVIHDNDNMGLGNKFSTHESYSKYIIELKLVKALTEVVSIDGVEGFISSFISLGGNLEEFLANNIYQELINTNLIVSQYIKDNNLMSLSDIAPNHDHQEEGSVPHIEEGSIRKLSGNNNASDDFAG